MNGHTRRHGFTLVEMMAVIAVGAVLFGAFAATMSRVVRAHSDATQRVEDLVAMNSLAQRFRRDVHDALSIESDQGPGPAARLELMLGDGQSIEYELDDAAWRRLERTGDHVISRETWELRGVKIVGWSDDSRSSGLVTLRVCLMPADGRAAGIERDFEITAALRRAEDVR